MKNDRRSLIITNKYCFPRWGGGNMVTFEALGCIFTFGLLIVAIIALMQK